MSARRALILLVEDNLGDARLVREALVEAGAAAVLLHLPDGIEALAFLRREGTHAAAARPDLILLDLNLPRKSGREVLAEIKSDALLRRIPVVVLTSSQSDDDILSVYSLNANCYVPKPADLEHFLAVIRSIESFWFPLAVMKRTSLTRGGTLMSLADVIGFHNVRTSMPEYVRIIERGTMRTFGKDVVGVAAFWLGSPIAAPTYG